MANTFNHNGKVVITDGGNVGIGTTSPTRLLEISATNPQFSIKSTSATGFSELYFGDNTADNGWIGYAHNGDYMYFGTNNSERMRITSAGNVGIGTTAPTAKLHVVGNGEFTDTLVVSKGASDTVQQGSSLYLIGGSGASYTQLQQGVGRFIIFGFNGSGWVERFTINNTSGNVGIGNTSPTAKLQVGAEAHPSATGIEVAAGAGGANLLALTDSINHNWFPYTDGSNYYSAVSHTFRDETHATNWMKITSGGNVGINTTSPREKLQVTGNTVIGSAGLNSYKTNLYLTYSAGADETWFRIYVPQDYVSSNNGGTIKVRVLWEGDHATFGAYQEYQISYKTYYPASPYLTFSNVFCTNKTSDFNTGSTYYPPSSTPDVNFYTAGDSYLYVLVKGYNAAYNTARYIEAEIFGRTTAQPTIGTTTAPGSPSLIPKTIQFLPQEGNIYASGSVGIGTTSPSTNLHVAGSVRVTGDRIDVNSNTRITGAYYENSNTEYTYIDMYNGGNASINIGTKHPLSYISFESGNGAYTERMRITNTGNVGIGTTSPSYKLQVNSDAGGYGIVNTNGTVIIGTYIEGSNNYASFGTQSNHGLGFFTNNAAPQMYINTSGNVGIGTTSPTVISGYIAQTFDGVNGSFIDYRQNGTALFRIGADTSRPFLYGMTNAPMDFYTNTNFAMRITAAGNVGIGTTSPNEKLHVAGNVHAYAAGGIDAILYASTSAGSTTIAIRSSGITHFNGGNVGIGTTSPAVSLQVNASTAAIRLEETSASAKRLEFSIDSSAVAKISANQSAQSIAFETVGSERMRITDAGNVGIGTTSPGAKLEISGFSTGAGLKLNYGNSSGTIEAVNFIANGGANGVIGMQMVSAGVGDLWLGGSGGRTLTLYRDGNVGIGTTSPTDKLAVVGNISIFSNNKLYNGSASDSAGISFPSNTTRIDGYSGITFHSSTTNVGLQSERMRITNDGNVGIGTTSPNTKLHLWTGTTGNSIEALRLTSSYAGTGDGPLLRFTNYLSYATNPNAGEYNLAGIRAFDFASAWGGGLQFLTAIDTNGGGNLTAAMTITSAQNVGIGTTSPGYKLDVSSDTNDGNIIRSTNLNAGAAASARFYAENNIGSLGQLTTYSSGFGFTVFNLAAGNFSALLSSGASSAGLLIGSLTSSPVVFGTNNTERMRITSGGNVGIGTTSPSEKLHVDGNVIVTYNNSFQGINSIGNKAILARVSPTTGIINYAEYATATNLNGFVMGSDDARVKGDIATDSLDFITNTSSRMFINSSGNVGIGTTSPAKKLVVAGASSELQLYSDSDISTIDSRALGNTSNKWLSINPSGGNVGINTTSPSYKLDVVGDARITSGSLGVGVAPNATDGRIDASNDIVAYSTSDQRLKENVTPIENALEKVKTLTGVEFDWKEETAHVHGYHGHDVGIIAQDVQAVLPEAVRTNESGYLSVRYEKMIALLIEANKELAARVELLEQKLKQ